MRTLLFGAALVTAFLLPVTPAAAQCCGGAAASGDHAAHAAPAPGAPGCCGDHQKAVTKKATKKADCCADHKAMTAMKADCCAGHEKAAKADCCGAQALPADDPAVAIAGLGLPKEFQFGGTPVTGLPAVR